MINANKNKKPNSKKAQASTVSPVQANLDKEKDSDENALMSISSLTYQESLNSLDLILDKLQQEEMPLEDIEEYYQKGQLYINHCENLLNKLEQKNLQIKPEDLNIDSAT